MVEEASPEIETEATPTAVVGENINDVATLSGLVSADRRRRSHLRPLQGRRLLRAKLHRNPDRDPLHGDRRRRRQRPLHLAELRHRLRQRRRRHLPLDRPLLRRRQQQRGQRQLPDENETTMVEEASPEIETEATADRGRRRKHQRRRHPLGPGQRRPAPAKSPSTSTRAPTAPSRTSGRHPDRDPLHGDRRRRRQRPLHLSELRHRLRDRGAGTYHWIAHFSGDANNNAAAARCDDENETTVVEEASPEIETEATADRGRRRKHQRRRHPLGPGQRDRHRRSHLRPLQGRRLLRGEHQVDNPDRDPLHGDRRRRRQRPLHLSELRHRLRDGAPAPTTGSPTSPATPTTKPASGTLPDENETTVVEEASPEIETEATADAVVGENINDVATLSGLVSADRRRRSHLRPLQGRRLLRAELHRQP